ncbi:DinB family protein [Chengkuizengella sediminis]|uniref:DinB family protein n=1 Tax=Chengkuizengella sediminis TaxID=1885917 RepID=UPI0013895BFF|nr:DinB family protein [Chengkuizengella sediminis]NDI35501.1 DinB family protein [Chengkuizengella sediminis]
MHATDLIILNFEEIRSRSIKVWKAIPEEMLNWKPDEDAFTCAEMIRHLLQGEFLFHQILIGRGGKALTNLFNPFETKEFISVDDELEFAQPYREEFLKYIKTFSINDLENIEIDLFDAGGYVKKLGDMLLRIAYHESVHTGQLLNYMRTMGIDRPKIWD